MLRRCRQEDAVGARLRQVRIEKLRQVERLQLDLVAPDDSPVRQFVLAGPNGCGKTTVLEAILFALGRDDLVLGDKERGARWQGGFPEGARVEVELEEGGRRDRIVRSGAGAPSRDLGDGRSVSGRIVESVAYFSSWRAPQLVGPLEPLGPGRRPADTGSNRLWRLKQRLIDEKSRRSFVGDGSGATREAEWLQALNRAWARLRGDDGTRLDVQIVDEKAEDLFADLFVVRGDERVCGVDRLSSGEIELVSAAGWLVTGGMQDGLLLIDEPELHLHAQWQATFLPALREVAPQVQIIASTHSDAPWSRSQPWERALLVGPADPRGTHRPAAAAAGEP